jgi:hypothetical protein
MPAATGAYGPLTCAEYASCHSCSHPAPRLDGPGRNCFNRLTFQVRSIPAATSAWALLSYGQCWAHGALPHCVRAAGSLYAGLFPNHSWHVLRLDRSSRTGYSSPLRSGT